MDPISAAYQLWNLYSNPIAQQGIKNWAQSNPQVAGKVGKALTTVGSAVRAPQLSPGGLGAQLQSIGGVYAAESNQKPAVDSYGKPIGPGMGTYGSEDVFTPSSTDNGGQTSLPSPGEKNPDLIYVDVPGRGSVKLSDLQREAAAREQAIRGNIETGFGQYEGRLSELESMFPQYQSQDEALVKDTSAQVESGIKSGYDAANQKLDLSRQNVINRGKTSVSDLAGNLRNMLKASSAQLGAMGAGSSSAAPMAAYAYSKIAAKERGGIQKQVNDQLLEVDQKVIDVQTAFTDAMTQAKQWASTQLQGIRDKYLPYITKIREAKANAPLQKMQALNSLEEGLLTSAKNEIGQIESEQRQFAMNQKNQAQTQLANLTALKLQLSNNANFDPQSIVFNQLQAMNTPQKSTDSYNYSNPWVANKKNLWDQTS